MTLTGAAGIGKTRLALEVAQRLQNQYAHGVAFIDLAPLTDPGLVPRAAALAVDVGEPKDRSVLHALQDELSPREMLLVLDNCEHVLDASAVLADGLVRNCPRIRILATSREGMRIRGETVWLVPTLRSQEANKLFVERAEAADSRLAWSESDAEYVAHICRRLDGIPLAIELAAARVPSLGLAQISARLTERLQLPSRGNRLAPRHQTLRAAMDWSYALLDNNVEQRIARKDVQRATEECWRPLFGKEQPMPYALSGGYRIHYQVDGAGPPLLLHAGFTCTLRDWYDLGYVEALRQDYRLIMLDPLGQGDSDKPHTTEAYAPDRRVLDALAVLDALGVDRTQFWGYSMGGRIGFDLAVQHPERFDCFILGGTRPSQSVPNVAWAKLFRQGMPDWVESVETALRPFPPSIHDRLLAADGEALAAATLAERASIEDRLGGIELPTLIYCGDQDTPHEGAKQAAEAMPKATFASLPGLNHIDAWVDCEAVLRHARAFLREATQQLKTV